MFLFISLPCRAEILLILFTHFVRQRSPKSIATAPLVAALVTSNYAIAQSYRM
jgi:hypothetical protein